jgi:hypothetical protein
MVAQAGAGWVLAPSLVQLWREFNTLAPRRSRKTDGSIGDAAHAARSSFHNPQNGFVDAIDITHDPANGCDAHWWARRIVEMGSARLDHVISNGQIWSQARAKEGWRPFTGSNDHRTHAHFAVRRDAVGRNSMATWTAPAVPQRPPQPQPQPKPQPQPQPLPQGDIVASKEELEAIVRKIVAEELHRTRQWVREELRRTTQSLTNEIRGR